MVDFSIPAVEFSEQWQQPQYVVPLLLIVGGDLVALALAQLAGGLYTAIPFSLGWVSYSISVLFATFAGKRLMPPQPDHSCVVVNGSSGFVTENTSWILGRLVRDFESWMESQTRDRLIQLRQWKDRRAREDSWEVAENYMSLGNLRSIGLCVSVYEPDFTYKAGVPKADLAYSINIMMVVLQLAIASVPFAVSGDWGVLLITGGGILLASITAALPQWRREKWNCRPKSRKTVVLTRGRGSQHAIVILGNRHGLDFEDLARGPEHIHPSVLLSTRIVLAIIALLSIALLICAAGKQQSIWYLLATLGLGTVQTQILAVYPRNPSAFGIHLRFITVIGNPRVMNTLFEVEEKYPGVGSSLLPIYFGEDLTEEESRRWEFLREKAKETKHQREMDEKDRRDKQRELYELAQRVPKKGKEPSERLPMALV